MILQFVKDPPYIRNAKPGRIDSIGFGLLAIWLGALQIVLDKGQEEDWFGAVWIRWTPRAADRRLRRVYCRGAPHEEAAGGSAGLQGPQFCDRVRADRPVRRGIYGIVTLLPLFYQTLMGYTAQAAGLAVSPRGIGAIVIMPFIGVLTGRIDSRWMIGAGFLGFGLTSFWMGGLTLQISQWSLLWPMIFSGMASGMVFVPLSTTAMGTLPNEQIGNASGLYNLLRNVGGSIGISVVNTLVARHQQLHQSELVQHLSAGSQAFELRLQALQQTFARTDGPGLSKTHAYGVIQQTLSTQAALWSYIDDFRYLSADVHFLHPDCILFAESETPGRRADGPLKHARAINGNNCIFNRSFRESHG